jgi:hypothetical protein
MAITVNPNEATAANRRMYFQCVDIGDGMTPETAEAGGQPQISTNGAAWTDTGIGVLVAIGNGRYYAVLTQAAVLTEGDVIEGRYKSANTAEAVGTTVQVLYRPPTVDAVWDEARSEHVTPGTFGEGVDSAAWPGVAASAISYDMTSSPMKAFLQPGFELQERVAGDTYSDVLMTLCDNDGNVLDMSAYSVSIRARMEDHGYQDVPAIIYNRYCTLEDADSGLIRFTLDEDKVALMRPVTELQVWVTLIDLEYTSYGSYKQITNINRPKIRIITQ